jgi:hypothetical protein
VINKTQIFINLVNVILENESCYFEELNILKSKQGYPDLKKKILSDYGITIPQEAYPDLEKFFISHIKESIHSFIDSSCVNADILLDDISKQVQIDYLLGNLSKDKVIMYYSLSTTLRFYGIHRDEKIQPLSNSIFWTGLIKKLYLLNFMSINGFNDSFEQLYAVDKSIPALVGSIKFFNNLKCTKITCIDGKIIFSKYQERSIVKLIEKKLQQLDIFKFMDYVLSINRHDKTIPFNYIVNLSLKNLNTSNHKKSDRKTFFKVLEFFIHFINLYQLSKTSLYESMFIDAKNIEKLLKKQVLDSILYKLSYPLKTSTLKAYIQKLLTNTILNDEFEEKFFQINIYLELLNQLELQESNHIIKLDSQMFKQFEDIFKSLSIDAKVVNQNYELPLDVGLSKNIFALNPIIHYKNAYYIIGFKYFKMYFYGALVEKIRLKINPNVTKTIGTNIDDYVEEIFTKQDVEIFKGKYKVSKGVEYECDLVVKTKKEVIFIENKNKFLTRNSFGGSSIHILQDFIGSFATSQFQLLRHEEYIRDKKKISFLDKTELLLNDERIIKISLSPNNWYAMMNNIPKSLIYSLVGLRFSFKEHATKNEIKSFEESNKDLEKLMKIVKSIHSTCGEEGLKEVLHNSLFIPLELISENQADPCLIRYIMGLISIRDGQDNIYDSFNNYKQLKNNSCGD